MRDVSSDGVSYLFFWSACWGCPEVHTPNCPQVLGQPVPTCPRSCPHPGQWSFRCTCPRTCPGVLLVDLSPRFGDRFWAVFLLDSSVPDGSGDLFIPCRHSGFFHRCENFSSSSVRIDSELIEFSGEQLGAFGPRRINAPVAGWFVAV